MKKEMEKRLKGQRTIQVNIRANARESPALRREGEDV